MREVRIPRELRSLMREVERRSEEHPESADGSEADLYELAVEVTNTDAPPVSALIDLLEAAGAPEPDAIAIMAMHGWALAATPEEAVRLASTPAVLRLVREQLEDATERAVARHLRLLRSR